MTPGSNPEIVYAKPSQVPHVKVVFAFPDDDFLATESQSFRTFRRAHILSTSLTGSTRGCVEPSMTLNKPYPRRSARLRQCTQAPCLKRHGRQRQHGHARRRPRKRESYTIAHHLFSENGNRKIMIASLRYLDTFAKIDGSWYFAERKLLLDWSETRPSTPGT